MKRIVLLTALLGSCSRADLPPEVGEGPVQARPIYDAIKAGVDHLVRTQNLDGSWGSHRNTTGYDVWASIPGAHDAFRTATTALAVMALREAKGPPKTIRAGVEFLLTEELPRRSNPGEMYSVWAHGYAIQALSGAYHEEVDPLRRARVRAAAERHLRSLEHVETMSGGWNYYDFELGAQRPASSPTSFGPAAILVAFWEAKRAGLDVPEKLQSRALRGVQACRKPDGSYLYDTGFKYYPNHGANKPQGTLGRAQPCNLALYLWGEKGIKKGDLAAGFDRLKEQHAFIAMGRKRQYPHEAWYFNSGYYYYFGHYYASRVIEVLDPGERASRRAALAQMILPHQETDGSWWDYAMYSYHKPYGTAFAVMTLLRCLDGAYPPKS